MFTTKQFDFFKTTRTLTAERSILGTFIWEKFKGNNYGITIYSHKTLKKVDFVLFKVDSNDNGIAGWWLRPSDGDVKKDKSLEGLQLLIIND